MFFFRYPDGYFIQNVQFDFFNYAGIHRHVTLYTTPLVYIEDITIVTDIQGTNGMYFIGGPRVPSCLKVISESLDFIVLIIYVPVNSIFSDMLGQVMLG